MEMQTTYFANRRRGALRKNFMGLLLVFCAGCAQPAVQEDSPAERAKKDLAVGIELARGLDAQLSFKQDAEISVYLRHIAKTLADSTPSLRGGTVGALIIRDREGKWQNFALPGNRIYLSAGLLRSIEFENELAAAIAVELGHVLRRHALKRLQQNLEKAAQGEEGSPEFSSTEGLPLLEDQPKKVDYFGTRGIFSFSNEDHAAAAQEAVGILYRAGFDPRGLAALWARFSNNPEHSPHDLKTVEKLAEATRHAIAQNAPLRNPVVRSQAFLSIQKRIRKL